MSRIATVDINDVIWNGPYLSTIQELSEGLAGVESIPQGVCAFFDMGAQTMITVTVQEMLFPLDIIFIDENFNVVQVSENVVPGAPNISCTARYFVEMNAGEAAAVNIGDVATISISTIGGTSTNSDIVSMMSTAMIMGMTMMMASMMIKSTTQEKVFADTGGSIFASARDDVRGVLLAECRMQND